MRGIFGGNTSSISSVFSQGYQSFTDDWAYLQSAPAITGGVLICGWHRGYGTAQLDSMPCTIWGTNWATQMICDNYILSNQLINENTSIFNTVTTPGGGSGGNIGTYVGDFALFNVLKFNVDQQLGWKFSAMYIYDTGTTWNQYMFMYIPGWGWSSANNTGITYATIGVTPGASNFLQVGGTGGAQKLDMCYWRVYANYGATPPTTTALDVIRAQTAPDFTAWADWTLLWNNGKPDFNDRSGNKRNLTGGNTTFNGSNAIFLPGNAIPFKYISPTVTSTWTFQDLSGTLSTATIPSWTPTANTWYLVTVVSRSSVTSVAPPAPSLSGNGLTWTQINTQTFTSSGGTTIFRITTFSGIGASPSTGTLSVSFGGQVQTYIDALCDKISNANTSSLVVQSNTNSNSSGTASSLSATLSSNFGNSANIAYGAFGWGVSTSITPTAGSGYTIKSNQADVSSLGAASESNTVSTNLTANMTFSGVGQLGGIVIELNAGIING